MKQDTLYRKPLFPVQAPYLIMQTNPCSDASVTPSVDPHFEFEQKLKRKIQFACLFSTVYCAWLLFNHSSLATRNIIGDVFGTVIAWIATCWSIQGIGKWCKPHAEPQNDFAAWRGRWGINLVSLGLFGYAVGTTIWSYYELVLHQEPFPSWADAAYLPGVCVTMIGLVLLPSRPLPAILRGRILLDSLMIIGAIITFSWYFILGPTVLTNELTGLARFLSVAYPMVNLTMLICVLLLSARQEAAGMRGRTALSIGMLSYVGADALFAYFTLKGTYSSGNPLDIGWSLGNFAIAIGVMQMRAQLTKSVPVQNEETSVLQGNPVLWRSLLPYLLVPAVGALLVFVRTHDTARPLANGVYLGAVLLIGLILLRQVFALAENNRLNRYIQEAYHELGTKNEQLHTKTVEAVAYAQDLENLNAELQSLHEELQANNDELIAANVRLEALATTDGMTGLSNHRAFQERLAEEIARARRTQQPVALLVIDVDKFKLYNDAFGHPAGDEALRIVARLLKEHIRTIDFPARYGGEEFAVILPTASEESALTIAERIRTAIADHPFPHQAVTLSIGIAIAASQQEEPAALIASADQALYHAKRTGRNRTVVFTPDLAEAEQSPALPLHLVTTEPTSSAIVAEMFARPEFQLLEALMATLNIRDGKTEGHSQRVARFCLRLAQEARRRGIIQLTEEQIQELLVGALLHDIGKLGVPDAIWSKPGTLTEAEWEVVRLHPERGSNLLDKFVHFGLALPVVRHHHERWDGDGYPSGLQGETIPFTARLFALVDTLDAMTSNRPYRTALSYEQVREEMIRLAGAQFDPVLVDVFLSIPMEDWVQLRDEENEPLRNAA